MVTHLTNSSRSSLVSAGSSYHSWEEEHNLGVAFINTGDQDDVAWHEITTDSMGQADMVNGTGSQPKATVEDAEVLLRQSTGLSKLDLMLIQGKLLESAAFRAKTSETRSPSTLRRRRPSAAQSMQSFGGPSRVRIHNL